MFMQQAAEGRPRGIFFPFYAARNMQVACDRHGIAFALMGSEFRKEAGR